jgi:hypothetical protein
MRLSKDTCNDENIMKGFGARTCDVGKGGVNMRRGV